MGVDCVPCASRSTFGYCVANHPVERRTDACQERVGGDGGVSSKLLHAALFLDPPQTPAVSKPGFLAKGCTPDDPRLPRSRGSATSRIPAVIHTPGGQRTASREGLTRGHARPRCWRAGGSCPCARVPTPPTHSSKRLGACPPRHRPLRQPPRRSASPASRLPRVNGSPFSSARRTMHRKKAKGAVAADEGRGSGGGTGALRETRGKMEERERRAFSGWERGWRCYRETNGTRR